MFDAPDRPQPGARRDDLPVPGPQALNHLPMGDGGPMSAPLLDIHRHIVQARRARRYLALLAVKASPWWPDGADPSVLPLQGLAAQLGQRLRARVRSVDAVVGSGDFELLALLPECRPPGARSVQMRLQAALGGTYRLGELRPQLRVAVGLACFPAVSDTAQGLLAAALEDQALRGSA